MIVSSANKSSNLFIFSLFHVSFPLSVVIFKACALSLRHALNHQKTSQKQRSVYTLNSKLPFLTRASPILLKKRQRQDVVPKPKNIHRQGKAGSHRHTTQFILALLKMKITLANIHPCVAFFFQQCKWGLGFLFHSPLGHE